MDKNEMINQFVEEMIKRRGFAYATGYLQNWVSSFTKEMTDEQFEYEMSFRTLPEEI